MDPRRVLAARDSRNVSVFKGREQMLRDVLRGTKYCLRICTKTVSDSQLRHKVTRITEIALDLLSYLVHKYV